MTMDEIVWRSDYDVAQFVFAREIHGYVNNKKIREREIL